MITTYRSPLKQILIDVIQKEGKLTEIEGIEEIAYKAIQIYVGNLKQEWIDLNNICINNDYLGNEEGLKIKFKK